jgi:hypothetical protein
MTGGLPPISSSWRQAPWDSRPDFFPNWTLGNCSPYVTSSLTVGWIYRLQMLVVLASAVIFRSESRGIHDILLSQMRELIPRRVTRYITLIHRPSRKHRFQQFNYNLLMICCIATTVSFFRGRCLETGFQVTILRFSQKSIFALRSSGMWRYIIFLVVSNVSLEFPTSFFRVQ